MSTSCQTNSKIKRFILPVILLCFCFTIESCSDGDCIEIDAEFEASNTEVEIGESVTFTDISFGDPISWSWTFEGGTPASSVEQNPTVSWSSAGTYSITLTVSNGETEATQEKQDFITVLSDPS